ncbi:MULTISPECIES: hypothetical protein [Micromonospora]|uniref:Uncharacterized protein n=1 Tax=Micromonospora solifontis TaxID=2487138 RepID=A0ABX9WN41_9ACTN|nr:MULTISPECIES: hypothetical protein [Micromonospora]NES14573.1 hypothetical protein [Micromonospora sp. PPF5-17B]NES35289.1 hypothetical protein [Micromonospora solifontis]RNM01015.1 hypothetical protein EFE23_03815 [Micromonospora solifontis]
MSIELLETEPTADQWEVVALSEVEDGDVLSFDLAALAERRHESVPRVDWTRVMEEAAAVESMDELGESVRVDFYDLAYPTVVGVPEMQVLRLV